MKRFILSIFVVLIVGNFVNANDTSGQLLPTGEIRFEKQDGIVLKHEALLLSDTVTVDYLFENITDKAVETTVFFPIPTVGPITDYDSVTHDFKFRVWSNGKEIKPELSRKITIKDTDVTKYFNMMGIDSYHKAVRFDPEDYPKVFEKVVEPLRKLPISEQEKLAKLGLLAKGCMEEDDEKCKNNPDIYHLGPNPAYSAEQYYKQEVMYYWKQTFPPHKTVHIRHTYKPSFFDNSIGEPSDAVIKQLNWSYEKNRQGFWTEASYIITTANNWKTPIEKFNLLVWGKAGAAVSAYKDNETSNTRVAPLNYLIETKQDFVPTNEILFELAVPDSDIYSRNKKKTAKILPQLYRIDGPANVRTKPNGKKIRTLENGVYIWAYPADEKDWFIVLLDEKTTGYTHKNNLISFGKLD